ncbi:hypothetical protein BD410DRAFT_794723, partial [Rickenella mellea]
MSVPFGVIAILLGSRLLFSDERFPESPFPDSPGHLAMEPGGEVFDTPVNLREPRRLLAPTCSDAKSIHRAT